MPKSFERCVSGGGRVRTVRGPNKALGLEKKQYCHICFKDGKSFRGETKTKKSKVTG